MTDEDALAAALAAAAEEEAETEDAAAEDATSETTEPEAPVVEAAPEAPVSEEDALAAALAEAAEAAEESAATETETETADTPIVAPDEQTAEDAAALEAARLAAEAAELAAAAPVDPIEEAEAQIAAAETDAAEAQQSLALQPEAAPVAAATEEVITEETARQPDEDFGRLMTATTEAAPEQGRTGLTGTQGLLLGGIAGLAIGSIIAGNRQVVNRADDRIVVLRPGGDYQVIRDDDTLLRRPGNTVATETFADGSSRNIVTQPDGTQVITVRDRDLRILRRTVVHPDGTRTVLIDDIAVQTPVVVSELPQVRPGTSFATAGTSADAAALARALGAQSTAERSFSLAQVRSIRAVRDLAPALNLENVTFATGSAAISPDQATQLLSLGRYMADAIARNPREIFLVEGHTDATGSASFNLGLSDRRAETVALALTEYFGVPAQNMVIQGYGEEFLLVPTLESERLNRRVAVRRITDLLRVAASE
jgi:outer membrane protein OmpA-like peptidoglycan-associated protein